MNYLINNFFIPILFSSFIIGDCYQQFQEEINNNLSEHYLHVSLSIEDSLVISPNFILSDSINIIINKDAHEFVLDFNNSVLILNSHKSMNYFKKTNQLYIDYPDSLLIDKLFGFIDSDSIKDNCNTCFFQLSENKYAFKSEQYNYTLFIDLNKECNAIDKIEFLHEKFIFSSNQINLQFKENYQNIDYLKILGFPTDYFEFDLR